MDGMTRALMILEIPRQRVFETVSELTRWEVEYKRANNPNNYGFTPACTTIARREWAEGIVKASLKDGETIPGKLAERWTHEPTVREVIIESEITQQLGLDFGG